MDGPVHILFECKSFINIRSNLWDSVLNSMPASMAYCVNLQNNDEKLDFIISGMKCETYVEEWSNIYYHIANFIYCMYKERAQQYDNLALSVN